MANMEPQALADVFAGHPFFRDLKEPFIHTLAECAQETEIPPETLVFHAGDPATAFLLILHGHITLEAYTPHRHAISIQTLGPGEVVGWSWLLPPYRWQFDVRTEEPSRVISFDGQCLRRLFDENHELGYQMLTRFLPVMTQHLRAMQMQLLEIYETEPNL